MRTGARRERLPNWAIGLILVIALVIASLYAFTKSVPWANPHTVQAVFPSAANIRPASPVRIAGVNVGKVTKIEHLQPDDAADLNAQAGTSDDPAASVPSTATVVTMELEDSALPIHTDATMKLRPRLFLEGNLFVDLRPGTPNAEEAEDGYVFPVSQTSIAVQIDQIFTTLQADVRSNLQTLLDELGTAFKNGGAAGFREIYKSSPGAFRYTAEVNEAFLGTEEHDLSELIVNLDSTIEALNQGRDLQDLVTNLRVVLGSFAAETESLEQAIAILPDVLREGRPALASLNESFPALRAFSREALPGVRSTPAMLDAVTPLLRQVRGLVSKPELRGLTADLRVAIPDLAALSKQTVPTLEQARPLSSCFNEVIVPFGYQTVEDDQTPASGQIYEELGYGLVGIAGESRSGDANGPYIRVQAGGGANTITYPNSYETATGLVDAIGITPAPLLGAIPAQSDSAKTPFRPGVPCERQLPPDLGASSFDLDPLVDPLSAPVGPRQASDELIAAVEEANAQLEELQGGQAPGEAASTETPGETDSADTPVDADSEDSSDEASADSPDGVARAEGSDEDASAEELWEQALADVAKELAAVYDMEYLLDLEDSAP